MHELTEKHEKTSHSESEGPSGISMMPPAFQLMASPVGENENAALSEDGAEGGYEVKVANHAQLVVKLENAIQNKNHHAMMGTLEALKHNQVETSYFREFFQAKKGKSIEAYVTELWGPEPAEDVAFMLDSQKGDDNQGNIEAYLFDAISTGNTDEIYFGLNMSGDIAGAAKRYQAQYAGQDLYTDVMSFATPENGIAEIANRVFGKNQNYEKVSVKNEEEANEARMIISRIYEQYGIELNSQKSLDAELEWGKHAPQAFRDQLKTSSWNLPQLRDLERALADFSPILGKERENSDRAGVPQEISSIGRLNKDLTFSNRSNEYFVSSNTSGEFSDLQDNVSLYDNIDNTKGVENKYNANGKNDASLRENTISHELVHGLFKHLENDYARATGFWKRPTLSVPTKHVKYPILNENVDFIQTVHPGIEAPPLEYGKSNVSEDLAVSVTLYIHNPSVLVNGSKEWQMLNNGAKIYGIIGNPCPKRKAFIDKYISPYLNH